MPVFDRDLDGASKVMAIALLHGHFGVEGDDVGALMIFKTVFDAITALYASQ